MKPKPLKVGAFASGPAQTAFRVWAPFCRTVDLKLWQQKKTVSMQGDKDGYFFCEVPRRSAQLYTYVLNQEKERPDPASRYQPRGVHGPSEVIEEKYEWQDQAWKGLPLPQFIFYELHIGTFTPEGTFAAAAKKISYLIDLGITCIEIMPVAQFPGKRNWGYDGVGLFAVQNSYGGPAALKAFVNECHRQGLAVCLDVVYNHFGPEGNYLHDYGHYFTKRHQTPWGDAVNYDDYGSKHVRNFVLQNVLYWLRDFHFDALRLDAVHSIFDDSPKHLLREIREAASRVSRETGVPRHIIAESDLNDPVIIRPAGQGGYGVSSQWSDDFHHAMHHLLTGEKSGYYLDYGKVQDVAKAIAKGFVFEGQYSRFRKRKHGKPAAGLPPEKMVSCVQNHDQIGNRAMGERLSALLSFEKQKLAAAVLLLSPHLPLLFMGEEYGETNPFQYFIDHGDPGLVEAVRKGRRAEFAAFGWEQVPDPASPATFKRSKLQWKRLKHASSQKMRRLYRDLIFLRRAVFFSQPSRRPVVKVSGGLLKMEYRWSSLSFLVFANFSNRAVRLPKKDASYLEILCTESAPYGKRRTFPPGRIPAHSLIAGLRTGLRSN